MVVGSFVRALRQAAGMTQHDLAKRMGVSASMLSLVEAGKREPTIQMLSKIAHALDIPHAVLLVAAASSGPTRMKSRELYTLTQRLADELMQATQRAVVARRIQQVHERGNR